MNTYYDNKIASLEKEIESNRIEIEKIRNLLNRYNIVDETELDSLKKENERLEKVNSNLHKKNINLIKENEILKSNEKVYNNLENLTIADILFELKEKYTDKEIMDEMISFLNKLHPYY